MAKLQEKENIFGQRVSIFKESYRRDSYVKVFLSVEKYSNTMVNSTKKDQQEWVDWNLEMEQPIMVCSEMDKWMVSVELTTV